MKRLAPWIKKYWPLLVVIVGIILAVTSPRIELKDIVVFIVPAAIYAVTAWWLGNPPQRKAGF